MCYKGLSRMGYLPASLTVQHKVWLAQSSNDAHGNAVHSYADPVNRKVIAYYPLGWQTGSPDVISPDYVARLEFNLEMIVDDASVYKKLDLVIVDDEAYEVQSIPYDWDRGMPFAGYGSFVGGTVHIRKVT